MRPDARGVCWLLAARGELTGAGCGGSGFVGSATFIALRSAALAFFARRRAVGTLMPRVLAAAVSESSSQPSNAEFLDPWPIVDATPSSNQEWS